MKQRLTNCAVRLGCQYRRVVFLDESSVDSVDHWMIVDHCQASLDVDLLLASHVAIWVAVGVVLVVIYFYHSPCVRSSNCPDRSAFDSLTNRGMAAPVSGRLSISVESPVDCEWF